jgi:hypothetical protein
MRRLGSPFRIPAPFPRVVGETGARPVFTALPVLTTGPAVIGDTLTVTFTATGTGSMTAQIQFFRDGAVVQDDTISITSGAQASDTYLTSVVGAHSARVTVMHDGAPRWAGSNTISVFASAGAFNSAFSDAFQRA